MHILAVHEVLWGRSCTDCTLRGTEEKCEETGKKDVYLSETVTSNSCTESSKRPGIFIFVQQGKKGNLVNTNDINLVVILLNHFLFFCCDSFKEL